MPKANSIDTFICANTPKGFYSLQDNILNEKRVYIVKGGPGTGKSTFMKRIGEYANEKGYETEKIHCSSDPASLDGLFIKELSLALFDGTPPHLAEPNYPGAGSGLIDLGRFWDEELLMSSKAKIVELNQKIKECYDRAYKLLSSVGTVQSITHGLLKEGIYLEKLEKYATNLANKLFENKKSGKGKETPRFLTAINHAGVVTYSATLSTLTNKLYVIEDGFFCIAPTLLSKLNDLALEAGYDTMVFYSPFDQNKLEHLCIPSLKIGFATATKWANLKSEKYLNINSKRFLDEKLVKENNVKLKFFKKLESNILKEAIHELLQSKILHDDLEKCYIPAMNFKCVEELEKFYQKKLII